VIQRCLKCRKTRRIHPDSGRVMGSR
jgi:hypothetical protein